MTVSSYTALQTIVSGKRCPDCNVKLKTVDDGEGWTYCSGCDFGGSIIEIGSVIWKCDLPTSLERLQRDYKIGTTDQLKVAEKRQQWRKLWVEAKTDTPSEGDCVRLLGSALRWTRNFAVIAPINEFVPLTQRKLLNDNEKNKNCLYIPFYSQFGKTCGVLAYAAISPGSAAPVYIPIEEYTGPAYCVDRQVDNKPLIAVFGDARQAILAALRWKSGHYNGLPIAGCHHTFEYVPFTRPGSAAILIADQAEVFTAKLACQLDLPVSTSHAMPTTIGVEQAWIKSMSRVTFSWVHLLRRAWNKQLLSEALLRSLPKQLINREVTRLPRKLLEAVNKPSQQDSEPNEWAIEETDKGWMGLKSKRQISNYNLRVVSIIQSPSEQYYKCEGTNSHSKVEYVITRTQVDKLGFVNASRESEQWLTVTTPLRVLKSWYPYSLEIAMQNGQPATTVRSGKLGWCQTTRGFQFARFGITAAGKITSDSCLPIQLPLPSDNLPASSLILPRVVHASAADIAESDGLWLCAAVMIWHIIAPALDVETGVTIVASADLLACRRLFNLFGCRNDADWRYNWPTVTHNNNMLQTDGVSRIFAGEPLACWAGAAVGLPRVHVDGLSHSLTDDEKTFCQSLIPAFISYFLSQVRLVRDVPKTLADCVRLVQHWAASKELRQTRSRVKVTNAFATTKTHVAIMQIVYQLWKLSPDQVLSRTDRRKETHWFCGEQIVDQLKKRNLPSFSLDQLRVSFELTAGYVGEIPAGRYTEFGISIRQFKKLVLDEVPTGLTRFSIYA